MISRYYIDIEYRFTSEKAQVQKFLKKRYVRYRFILGWFTGTHTKVQRGWVFDRVCEKGAIFSGGRYKKVQTKGMKR